MRPKIYNMDEMTDEEMRAMAAALMGKKGGSARTTAKQAAARENGKKGGRPRKVAAK